jgi:hydrogenase expression/formation protein HypC
MCLAVPMKVLEIEENRVRCAALEQERWADLMLMPENGVSVGDYVVVHLGFVQRTVPESEALEAYELFDDILKAT